MPTLSRRTATIDAAKARREEAFFAATTQLLEEGVSYAELGVEAIARRAGSSRATFYAYFVDKRELLLRLAERAAGDVEAETSAWLRGDRHDLRALMAAVLRLFDRHRQVAGALVEAATYDDEVSGVWRALHGRFIEAAVDHIASVQPRLDPQAVQARAFSLVWMTERACYEHLTAPRVDDDHLLDALTVLWHAGVHDPPRQPLSERR
jgi:AcrR family transcriptional regulator